MMSTNQNIVSLAGVCVLFVFENIIGIIFVITGIVFLNDCPLSKAIPISLLVVGVVSVMHAIIIQMTRWKWIDLHSENDKFATFTQVFLAIITIVYFVTLVWAIFSVFYHFHEVETHNKDSENYCNYFLYWFSFSMFVLLSILCIIFLVLIVCLICLILSTQPKSPPLTVIILQQNSGSGSQSDTQSVSQNTTAQTPGPTANATTDAIQKPNTSSQPNLN